MNNGVLKAVKKQEKELKKQEITDISVVSSLPKVTINKKVLDIQNTINDELVEIGGDEFYSLALEQLRVVIHLLKKVDLNDPNKQNFLSRFFEIDRAVDYVSNTHRLYFELLSLKGMSEYFDAFLTAIDSMILKIENGIDNSDGNLSLTNKTIFLSQIKTVEQFKMSTLILKDSCSLILENPDIQRYMFYWKKFGPESKYRFPRKNIFNDNAYLLEDYENVFVINGQNFFEFYNEIDNLIHLIWKYAKYDSRQFDMFVGMRYYNLRFEVYAKGLISKMIEMIENEIEKIEKKENTSSMNDVVRKYHALLAVRNEFVKLEKEVEKIINDPKISMYAKNEGLDFDRASLMDRKK